MPRFQIFVGQHEVHNALSFLVLVRGMSVEAAVEYLEEMLAVAYEVDGETRYTFFEEATGVNIFTLLKKYRALFGQSVQIKKVD